MKLLLRIAVGLVALVIVVAIALAVAVAVIFEPKDYQPLLVRTVEIRTGRSLTLEGELALRLFPCCGVAFGPASLGNPEGFPAEPFLRVSRAALSLRLWPLLARQELQIGTVRLEGLDVSLLRRADGRANWEFSQAASPPHATTVPGEPAGGALQAAGFRIRGGRIAYRDEQAKSFYTASDIKLDTGAIAPDEPFDIEASFRLTDESDGTSAKLALKSVARTAGAAARMTLTEPLLQVEATGPQLPGKDLVATFGAKALDLDMAGLTRIALQNFEGEFTLHGLETPRGDLNGSFASERAHLKVGPSTEFATPAMNIDVEMRGPGIPGNTLAATGKLAEFTADLDQLRGGIGSLELKVTGLGAALAATGGGRFSETGFDMKGSLRLHPLSPRSLLAVLNMPAPETADPQALTRLSGTAQWRLQPDAAGLANMDVQLDQSRIRGRAAMRGFDKPVTAFDLQLDGIDLDRYLAPQAAGAAGAASDPSLAAPTEIPLGPLRRLQLDGQVAVGRLTLYGTRLREVKAGIRAGDGRLRLEPLSATLYGGAYRGAVTVDATGERARIATDQQLTGLRLGGVLRDLYQTDRLQGTLTGRIDLSATGRTDRELLQGLAGSVSVQLTDGVYQGMDIWHEIRNARQKLRGHPPLPAPAQPQTPIKALELAGDLRDGVLRSDRMMGEIPFLRLTGRGSLNVVDRTMDYTLQAKVFETPVFPDGGNLDDLTGLTIPFTVKGPLDGPKVGVDLKSLATDVALQKGKQRLLEKLGLGEREQAGSGATGEAPPGERQSQPPPDENPRDALKRSLRDLLKR